MKKVICGARCPDENGGRDYICQLQPHELYPAAKHLDDREGYVRWTQGGADRVAAELAAKQKTQQQRTILYNVGACGAIEGPVSNTKIAVAYEMFENFRAGRDLRYAGAAGDIMPWLHSKKMYSKFWQENLNIHWPFGDHFRLFVDKATKQRIVTIQPYWGRVANEIRMEFSKEFRDLDMNWNLKVGLDDERFERRPDVPEVRDGFAALLNAVQQKSDEFADKYGLVAKVSLNGWYNPERTILIEYTKKS